MEVKKLTPEQLEKLKQLELEAVLEIDRICKKHKIPYTLAYGTLLGAVRHKGFIPWDDDVDICMLRKDYEKFAEICKTELGSGFFYQSHDTDPEYFYLYDKLRVNGTVFRETYLDCYDIHHGVFVDIFPIDNYCGRVSAFQYRLYRVILNSKYLNIEAREGKKKIFAKIIRGVFGWISLDSLYEKAERLARKNAGKPADEVQFGCLGEKTRFPRAYFQEICPGDFEGKPLPIPVHFDEILAKAYGDYMELPPEDERQTVHELVEIALCTDCQ